MPFVLWVHSFVGKYSHLKFRASLPTLCDGIKGTLTHLRRLGRCFETVKTEVFKTKTAFARSLNKSAREY
jgi:hypothetical protein